MRRSIRRVRGLGFIAWHARHMMYHVLLGVMWVWYLSRIIPGYGPSWLLVALAGSLLPDTEHFIYFLTYGRKDPYTRKIRSFLRQRQWRVVALYIEKGHKHNTRLKLHNIYTVGVFSAMTAFGFILQWQVGVIFFGAMVIHYVFDICDDIMTLGYVNSNWV